FRLREEFYIDLDRRMIDPRLELHPFLPPPHPVEDAMQHFEDAADRMRHCANPQCPAPFFFAARRNQHYCSEKCAGRAQREHKRRWWQEHGAAKRRAAASQRATKRAARRKSSK